MKYSFFAIFAMASAVMVTETDYNTFYVTVNGDSPATTSSTPAPAPTTTSSSSSSEPAAPLNYNYATTSSGSSSYVAPAPTTSSSSSSTYVAPAPTTSSSSSSTYVAPAPTTSSSSSSSTYVAPAPTTSSSSSSSSVAPAPTTSSSSSTYVAPTTSSSSTYVAPTTTSSSTPVTTTSSSTSSAPSPTSTLNSFESDIVNYHNKVRAIHQVGDVTWNSHIANYAQNYLDNSNCKFAHSGGPYGENIAIGYATIDDALDAWYNEENAYNYAAGQFSENTGHFTQMVWKGSTEVGCAKIDCSGRTYLACEYTPRGNIIGHFTENVFPPK